MEHLGEGKVTKWSHLEMENLRNGAVRTRNLGPVSDSVEGKQI